MARTTAKPKGIRRLERWLVGIAMAVVAVVLERLVMRSVKKEGRAEEPTPPSTSLTSKGAEVDID
jgi:hypothetical protein